MSTLIVFSNGKDFKSTLIMQQSLFRIDRHRVSRQALIHGMKRRGSGHHRACGIMTNSGTSSTTGRASIAAVWMTVWWRHMPAPSILLSGNEQDGLSDCLESQIIHVGGMGIRFSLGFADDSVYFVSPCRLPVSSRWYVHRHWGSVR